MRRSMSGLVGLAMGILAGCNHVTAPRIPADAARIFARTVATDFRFNSGVGERQRLVIRDQSGWTELWEELSRGSSPRPMDPVAFSREVVIFASMGSRPTGGYSITIEEVRSAGDVMYVLVHERSPGPNCVTTQAFTQPTAAVAVQSAPTDIVFVEQSSVIVC